MEQKKFRTPYKKYFNANAFFKLFKEFEYKITKFHLKQNFKNNKEFELNFSSMKLKLI